jgi:hypothetical protein
VNRIGSIPYTITSAFPAQVISIIAFSRFNIFLCQYLFLAPAVRGSSSCASAACYVSSKPDHHSQLRFLKPAPLVRQRRPGLLPPRRMATPFASSAALSSMVKQASLSTPSIPPRTAPAGTLPPGTLVTVGKHNVTIERWLSEGSCLKGS